MKEFKYEIKKQYGKIVYNDGSTLEVNLISYNGAEPRIDIRRWNRMNDRMLKGITLSAEEAEEVKGFLQTM